MVIKDVKEVILVCLLGLVCLFSLFIVAFGAFYGFSPDTIKNFGGYLEQAFGAALVVGGGTHE